MAQAMQHIVEREMCRNIVVGREENLVVSLSFLQSFNNAACFNICYPPNYLI